MKSLQEKNNVQKYVIIWCLGIQLQNNIICWLSILCKKQKSFVWWVSGIDTPCNHTDQFLSSPE